MTPIVIIIIIIYQKYNDHNYETNIAIFFPQMPQF